MKHLIILYSMTLILFSLSGCMPSAHSINIDEHKNEVDQALHTANAEESRTGSLWSGGGLGLLSDPKAGRVGDLVTVLVEEKTSATRSLGSKKNTTSGRATDFQANISVPMMSQIPVPDIRLKVPANSLEYNNSKNFTGSGSTSNSDTLTASVTSIVTKVYANGNMFIIGRRQVTINHQPQKITFSGIIRPNDISSANTISSSKVAQANVSYGGGGELATVAHEGWLGQTLDQIWPF